jgi:chemotaxis protein MotB
LLRHKQYRQRTRPNHERWLVSYADFITLLFAFFVVLYASSHGDQKKAARVATAIENAFQDLGVGQSGAGRLVSDSVGHVIQAVPETGPRPMVEAREEIGHMPHEMSAREIRALDQELERALSLEISRHEVALRSAPDGLIISLQELSFFDSGSASLRASSRDAFARIAAVLQERKCEVRIEGHTDPVPIHTAQFDSNWELSTARATGLVKLLIQKYNYEPTHLAAGGYAEYHPIAENDTPEGRRTNRRVDLVIVSALVPDVN